MGGGQGNENDKDQKRVKILKDRGGRDGKENNKDG